MQFGAILYCTELARGTMCTKLFGTSTSSTSSLCRAGVTLLRGEVAVGLEPQEEGGLVHLLGGNR